MRAPSLPALRCLPTSRRHTTLLGRLDPKLAIIECANRTPILLFAVCCACCPFCSRASPAKLSLSKAKRGARAKSGSHQTCANDTWDLEPKCRQIDVLTYLKARLPPNYRRTTLLGRNTFATTAHKTSEETARRKTRPLLLHVRKTTQLQE